MRDFFAKPLIGCICGHDWDSETDNRCPYCRRSEYDKNVSNDEWYSDARSPSDSTSNDDGDFRTYNGQHD